MTENEFNSYVKQSGRRLYYIAFRYLGNREDSEDAVQEILTRLWKMGSKTNQYESTDALTTVMIKNYCIDQLRKIKKMEKSGNIPDSEVSVSAEEILEKAESELLIMEIITSMPETYRKIIQERDIDGLSYNEISAKNNQNINTLRVNLSRARTMLRNEYRKRFR